MFVAFDTPTHIFKDFSIYDYFYFYYEDVF